MKKQATAFFTLFSLILMLTIYYITIPKNAETNIEYESVISSIDESITDNKDNALSTNDEIISDSTSSIEDKENAIIENEQIKESIKIEDELHSLILDLGYENHIEIKDKTLYIQLIEQEEDDTIASKVMKTLYNKVGNNYFIELSFLCE